MLFNRSFLGGYRKKQSSIQLALLLQKASILERITFSNTTGNSTNKESILTHRRRTF